MPLVPEIGLLRNKPQECLLHRVLGVRRGVQPGIGQVQQHAAVLGDHPADVFIGTKRIHVLNSFHLLHE